MSASLLCSLKRRKIHFSYSWNPNTLAPVCACVSTLTSVTTAVSSPAEMFLYVHVCVLIYITRPLASSSFIVKSVLVTVSHCSASQMCQQTAESPASTQLRIPPFWKTLKVMQKVPHKNCIKTIKPSHTEAFRVGNVWFYSINFYLVTVR